MVINANQKSGNRISKFLKERKTENLSKRLTRTFVLV